MTIIRINRKMHSGAWFYSLAGQEFKVIGKIIYGGKNYFEIIYKNRRRKIQADFCDIISIDNLLFLPLSA